MKKALSLFLLIGTFAQAQTITIPDAHFKSVLLSTAYVADVNDNMVNLDPDFDGQIELADALLVHTFIIEGENLTDVTGLTQFANVNWMSLQNNQIASIDLAGMNNLGSIWLDGNPLVALNIDALPTLNYLQAYNTTLTNVTVTNCNLLTTVWLNDCPNLLTANLSNNAQLSAAVFDNSGELQDVDLSGCPMMEYLSLGQCNHLKNLNLSGAAMITDLGEGTTIDKHELVSLDVSNCSSLQTLWLEGADNALETINLANCPALSNVILANTKLPEIDLSGAPNITYLVLRGLMTSLDLTGANSPLIALCTNGLLQSVAVNDKITDLDVSNNSITSLDLSAATQLNFIDCAGNPLIDLNIKNGSIEQNVFIDNPTLQFVCADENQITAIESIVPGTVVVNSYCSFTPGGPFNTIAGQLRFDQDMNGCSVADPGTLYTRINISDNTETLTTFTNQLGHYEAYKGIGNFTVTPVFENASFFTVNPVSAPANFTDLGNETMLDFCIAPNGSQPDLEVVIAARHNVRTAVNADYHLVYRNKGNVALSGAVQFQFDDAVADFVSASVLPAVQNAGNLSWNFSGLLPFEMRSIRVTLDLNGPTDTPPLNVGDAFGTAAAIDQNENELNLDDNNFTFSQDVVAAYDPNDKTCLEGETLSAGQIGKYLHYNINFENIGSADAVNVVVRDTINTAQFDLGSLQLMYASHPVHTRINGNVVEFIFEDINLPPSISNPIGGHGNVLFKIRTLPTLEAGDMVANTANIYFDYNHPIQTNEARTTFNILQTVGFKTDRSVSIVPNPAKNLVSIKASGLIRSVQLFDSLGRILQVTAENKKETSLDISDKPKGIYYLKISTQDGNNVQKLVKE